MTAAVIEFAAVARQRGRATVQAIRLGDRVRRRTALAEGHVQDFRGRGGADTPVEALVLWSGYREWVPVAYLEAAP